MDQVLIIGYGNVDRQDDGVAWHVLHGIAENLDKAFEMEVGEGFQDLEGSPALYFQLQLTPEIAELITAYDRVCFVDAHTGNVPGNLRIEQLAPGYQTSAFTHHLTPQTCLALAESLYGKRPDAWLVSIRGYSFEFDRSLSSSTAVLAQRAINLIVSWIDNGTMPSEE